MHAGKNEKKKPTYKNNDSRKKQTSQFIMWQMIVHLKIAKLNAE